MKVAHILIADGDLAPRLVLKSILSAAGYAVTGAATAVEAMSKLDENVYQLVMADLRSESGHAGPNVLAYARQKDFRPATARWCSRMSESLARTKEDQAVLLSNEDIFNLLDRVASLIGDRADRRIWQTFRRAS